MTFREILFEDENVIISKVESAQESSKLNRVYIQKTNGVHIGDEEGYDAVRPPQENIMAIRKDGLWGFININGEIVTDFIYEEVGDFVEGYAFVKLITNDNNSICDNEIKIAEGHINADGCWILVDSEGNKTPIPKEIGTSGTILHDNTILINSIEGTQLYDSDFKKLEIGTIKKVSNTGHNWAFVVLDFSRL